MENPQRPLPPGVTPVTKSSQHIIAPWHNPAADLTEMREREQAALRAQAERDGLTPYLPDKETLHRADLIGAEMQKNIAEQIAREQAPSPTVLTPLQRLEADAAMHSAALRAQPAADDPQQALRAEAEAKGLLPYLPEGAVLTPATLIRAEIDKLEEQYDRTGDESLKRQLVMLDIQMYGVMTDEEFDAEVARTRSEAVAQKLDLFHTQPVDDWIDQAAAEPEPKALFDAFWHERDLCILFADTNLGKSILAVQIADSISRGAGIGPFRMEAEAQPVLYFDFELTAKQFQARYTHEYADPYRFSRSFFRSEINMEADYREWGYKTFESYLYAQIALQIEQTGVKVVIIDNLTALRSDNERAKDAYPIMEMLNRVKKRMKVSMLIIAHTPKRDTTRPIEENHLQGSKQFSNLCDSIFAIGKSHRDPRTLYLKQIKHRVGEKVYETDNVCLCQITKPYNFLGFEFMGTGREAEQLREMKDKDLGAKVAAVKDLHDAGKSQREIAAQLTIPLATVHRYLKRAEESGKAA